MCTCAGVALWNLVCRLSGAMISTCLRLSRSQGLEGGMGLQLTADHPSFTPSLWEGG